MIYVDKIIMKNGFLKSNNQEEIDSLHIVNLPLGTGWYKKEIVYDLILNNKFEIHVNISPYPLLIPSKSFKNEKYVKTVNDDTQNDNLMNLPKEQL